MDTREYIASGILESYVIGTASDQEQREVHCLSSIYPEIKEELERIQSTLENYVNSIAVTPPDGLKASILERIKEVPQEKVLKKVETPVAAASKEVKVVQMPKYVKLAMVASIAAVVGVSALFVMQTQENAKLADEVAVLETQNNQKQSEYLANLEQLEQNLAATQEVQNFITNEQTIEVVLGGTALDPDAQVRVYWQKDANQLVVKNNGLPKEAEGKQYQLWALADGVPVDLGVLDKDFAITAARDINIKDLQAFAITLEDEGGKPTPDLDQLYVVGEIKG